jgi:hypothetical protein
MAHDDPIGGTTLEPVSTTPPHATVTPQAPQPPHPHHTPYCHCGTPLHPDHVEKHRGQLLERYSCPNRRWWNALWHPHAWMEPRDNVQ